MSSQPPLIPFPLNPIFNIQDWIYADSTTLTIAIGDARYILKSGDSATGLIGFNAGLTSTSGAFSGSLTSSIPITYPNNSSIVATTAYVTTAISSIPVVSGTLIGSIVNYAGNSVPTGYLLCNGTNISRTTYSALFTAIGTIYGAGDGSTTFSIPNLVSKFVRGSSSSINNSTGSSTISLATANLPATTCTLTNVSTSGTNTAVAFNSPSGIGNWSYLKGTPTGDGGANYWTPRTNDVNSNGNSVISQFSASFGSATPTAITITPPNIDMMVLIKY